MSVAQQLREEGELRGMYTKSLDTAKNLFSEGFAVNLIKKLRLLKNSLGAK
jgi:hypothetical protein